jgi:hypothetical protein
MDFMLLVELLTNHAAEQQDLVSRQVDSPRAAVWFMRGLEMGVEATSQTISSSKKLREHGCGGFRW